MQEKSEVESAIVQYESLYDDYASSIELLELYKDDEFFSEAYTLLVTTSERAEQLKVECLFSGEYDNGGCYLEIQSGAGGTESNDWAEMLMRMYVRWAEIHHNYTIEILDKVAGEEVGIKSINIRISGKKSYGLLKTESGVHRLVRISPFDSNAKRHTSFASIMVSPMIDNKIDIAIEEKDLRIDRYRASGAGGQHVNTTESAIRITHIPSGIVVQCQNDRSQHKNRDTAMKLLKSKLYELEIQRKELEACKKHENKPSIGWGHQIRSYVMHPYQMIKDVRTGYETGNIQAVMDGDLDKFMYATLSAKVDI